MMRRFGQDYESVLQRPSKADLSNGFLVFDSKGKYGLVLEELSVASGKRRVGFNYNIIFSAEVNGFLFPEKRMDLELVDCRLNS